MHAALAVFALVLSGSVLPHGSGARGDYLWHEYVASLKLNARRAQLMRNLRNASRDLAAAEAPLVVDYRRLLVRIREMQLLDKLNVINDWTNRNIRYQTDRKRWNREDVWNDALLTLREGRGDCEDIAIVKAVGAAFAGIKLQLLNIVVGLVRWQKRWGDHAIFAVEYEPTKYYRFDNVRTGAIVFPAPDFIPLFALNVAGVWKIDPSHIRMKPLPPGNVSLDDNLHLAACRGCPGSDQSIQRKRKLPADSC